MIKPLYHITARSILKDTIVDLEYSSIKEAAYFNPGLEEFEIKGYKHK